MVYNAPMEKMHIQEVAQLPDVVAFVHQLLATKDRQKAVVVGLHGDLGAGKTTFMKAFAASLGVTEEVTSPTFVIMKGYEIVESAGGAKRAHPFSHLYHIDAYRIEDVDEMRVLGFEELLQQKDTIICIEWAENIAPLLPLDTLHITFTIVGEERDVTFAYHGEKN